MAKGQKGKEDAGEGYFASVSDLMVGLLFIFIIILMTFALKFRIAQTTVVNTLTDVQTRRSHILSGLKEAMKKDGVNIEIDLEHGIARLPESVLFPKGDSSFVRGGALAVGKLGKHLADVLPKHGSSIPPAEARKQWSLDKIDAIFIEGHTDDQQYAKGSGKDNWGLSADRSKVTYFELMHSTSDLDRYRNQDHQPIFSMSAYGDRRPAYSNLTPEGQKKNRRIDVRILMALPSTDSVQSSVVP